MGERTVSGAIDGLSQVPGAAAREIDAVTEQIREQTVRVTGILLGGGRDARLSALTDEVEALGAQMIATVGELPDEVAAVVDEEIASLEDVLTPVEPADPDLGGIDARSRSETVATGHPRRATFGTSTSRDYRRTFFEAHPQTEGQVVVHHAVEQQVQKHYPGVVSDSELHSLENLRGIPKGAPNNRVHLSQIRKEWNRFYKANPNPTKEQLLDVATRIDDKFGRLFNPPIR